MLIYYDVIWNKFKKEVGIAKIDEKKLLINFYEKIERSEGNLANAAVFILSNQFLNIIRNNNYYDFSKEVINKYLNKIYTYKTNNFFMDIGSKENLKSINERFNS